MEHQKTLFGHCTATFVSALCVFSLKFVGFKEKTTVHVMEDMCKTDNGCDTGCNNGNDCESFFEHGTTLVSHIVYT